VRLRPYDLPVPRSRRPTTKDGPVPAWVLELRGMDLGQLLGDITTVSKWCDGVVGLWDDR
jgi:hypothetical protein